MIDLPTADLLSSLTEQGGWKNLATLFDGEALKERLHRAYKLPIDVIITACEPDTPIYLPAEHSCILTYTLTLLDERSGQQTAVLLNARAFASHVAYQRHVTQLPTPTVTLPFPFTQARGELPLLNMTTAVFPLDDTLPTISRAMDEREITAVMRHALQNPAIHHTTITLIRYKHRRSCVLAYQPDGDPLLYGKISFHDTDATLVRAIEALQTHVASYPPAQQIALPRPYGFYPELQLTLLTAVDGDSKTIYRLIKDQFGQRVNPKHKVITLETALQRCAQAAAIIHRANISIGPTHTSTTELTELTTLAAAAYRLTPAFAHPIQSWLHLLQTYASRTPALPLCFSHGDFTYKQFLFTNDQSGLIDFDTICQAEPARDLGCFLAYLRIALFRFQTDAADVYALSGHLCHHFIAAYLPLISVNETHLRQRILLYEATTLIGILLHSWQKFKGHRLPHALSALEMVLQQIHNEVIG